MEQDFSTNKGLLTVSFGTSNLHARQFSLEAIETDLANAFPDRCLYRAWTSGMIRRKLEKQEGLYIPSIQESMEKMLSDGITNVLIQPTHMLAGEEFKKAKTEIQPYTVHFDVIEMGTPLLSCEEDAAVLAQAVEQIYGNLPNGECLAMMGHGSSGLNFPVYELLERQLRQDGYPEFAVGTVEDTPGIAPVLTLIRQNRPVRVHLAPLLIAAGEHVLKDMSGDGYDSWKNRIAREGCDVVCHTKGLGEYEIIRALYVNHAKNACSLI